MPVLVDIGGVAQGTDIGGEARDLAQGTVALGVEDDQAVGCALESLGIVGQQHEVVAPDIPAAQEGGFGTIGIFQGFVIGGVEINLVPRGAGVDAHYAGRQGGLLAGIAHGLGIAGREHVEVAVVGFPYHLIVLRAVAAAGVADLVALDDLVLGERFVFEESHPALVGVLGPLQFVGFVGAAARASRLGLDQVVVPLAHIAVGPAVDRLYVAPLAQPHGDGGRVEVVVHLFQSGEGHILAVAEEVLGAQADVAGTAPVGSRLVTGIDVGGEEVFGVVGFGEALAALVGVGVALGIDGAVARRGGHDVIVVEAVGGEPAQSVGARVLGHLESRVEAVRGGLPGLTLVVVEGKERLPAVEYPVGGAVVLGALYGRGHLAVGVVEAVGGEQHVGRVVAGAYRGGNHIVAFGDFGQAGKPRRKGRAIFLARGEQQARGQEYRTGGDEGELFHMCMILSE